MICEDVVVGPFRAGKFEQPPAKMDLRKYSHLDGVPFMDIEARVEALICSAHIAAWFGDGLRRKGKRDEPIAWSTAFGWTLGGLAGERGEITSELEDAEDHVSINLLTSSADSELRESIDRLFYNDFPWIRDEDKKDVSREARYALEQLKETTVWDVEAGKFKAGLPYKQVRSNKDASKKILF